VRYDIEAAKLASERAAALVHWKMGRGRASLAAIAKTAPYVGAVGMLVGVMTYPGGPTPMIMARSISEAIWPAAAGLLIALVASWDEKYIRGGLDELAVEMKAASHQLVNSLSLLSGGSVMPERIVRRDVEAAKHASERVAALTLRKMGRGRASLASIAATAFFVGAVGTIFGIVWAFRGGSYERSTIRPAIAQAMSESLQWTEAGLVIAIFAFWVYRYIGREIEIVDAEMKAVTLQLANSLSLLRQRIRE
jgi:biopolymer transport protein ExbB